MRIPSCNWRIGKAEVNTSGWAIEETAGSTALPFTLKRCARHACANNIVDAGVVCLVGQVEALSKELEVGAVTHLKAASDTHVKVRVVRPQTGIARSANRTIIGRVTITIHVSAGQEVEGMTAVVLEHRRQLEVGEEASSRIAGIHNRSDNDLMALVKV